jgi:hypothetical protein
LASRVPSPLALSTSLMTSTGRRPRVLLVRGERLDEPDQKVLDRRRWLYEWLRGYRALFPVFWFGVLLAEGLRRAESHTLDGWLVHDLDPNLRLRR